MPSVTARPLSHVPASANAAPVAAAPQSRPFPSNSRPAPRRFSGDRSSARPARYPAKPRSASGKPGAGPNKPEADILFQKFFQSVGPRTYAAQLKRAGNGNHFLVLTEGKRDEATGEVRKTRLFLFSEDFGEFFRMLHETAKFIRENPVPPEVRDKRAKFWAKKNERGS